MDAFRIKGPCNLNGKIGVPGAKNAALPLMAAALLTEDEVVLQNVPAYADVGNLIRLLRSLGASVTHEDVENPLGGTVRIQSNHAAEPIAPYEIVKTMRASISVLGPLLAARGCASVSLPGGCAFGARPVDLHLHGLRALDAKIELEGGQIKATAPVDGLKGRIIFMGGPNGPTVGGTQNVLCAAVMAKGRTIIESAACEPEVSDLVRLLRAMGAQITGEGSPRLVIDGVPRLHGCTHRVMPDRIIAGTDAIAAAITCGQVELSNYPQDSLLGVEDVLQRIGVRFDFLDDGHDLMRRTVCITAERRQHAVEVTTQPWPGFPTDLQAQLLALLTLADGNSVVTEKIYSERFNHTAELERMGAVFHRIGPSVVVRGVPELNGAPVMASDLRGSACLVLAGLAAHGETVISRVYHLDRGYHRLEDRYRRLGADIERFNADASDPDEPAAAIEIPPKPKRSAAKKKTTPT
jgi:UDP-N-acetylglucosamine 1-carboxyvinyltransferase